MTLPINYYELYQQCKLERDTLQAQNAKQAEVISRLREALEELDRALCAIKVIQNTDGYDLIRRESVINIVRNRVEETINRSDE